MTSIFGLEPMIDLVEAAVKLDEKLVNLLLEKFAFGIRIENFLSSFEVDELHRRILHIGLENYIGDTKGGTCERKGKIGPNLFRFRHDTAEYFSRLDAFEAGSKPLLFAGIDVPGRFRSIMQESLPTGIKFQRAFSSSAARKLSDCTVRSLPSAPPHRDWIRGEMPGFDAVNTISDQFAWNVYITTGRSGGETAIYDAGEDGNAPGTMAPAAIFRPQAGDLILFRTRNLHEVRATDGDRFTVSGFWGPRDDGDFQYWV